MERQVDALGFVQEALAARGALVEPGETTALALLPAELGRALGVAEILQLTGAPPDGPGELVFCGYGSPLLERLVGEERERTPTAFLRLTGDAPRAAQAMAAAGRLMLRNGLCDALDTSTGEATYLLMTAAYSAEADDLYEGLVSAASESSTGGAPDDIFLDRLTPARIASGATVVEAAGVPGFDRQLASDVLAARVRQAVKKDLQPILQAIARRQLREHERIVGYFADLAREARNPRRAVSPEAIRAKLDHLAAERDGKLRDLSARYALRVAIRPAALICVTAAVTCVRLRLRRRKAEREIIATLPAGARAVDALACSGCRGATRRPLACDAELHLLCESCAPHAEGRPDCAACKGSRQPKREPGTGESQTEKW